MAELKNTVINGLLNVNGEMIASNLKKRGGADTHVLLAGGGIKPLTDFQVSGALDGYLPLSGWSSTATAENNMTGPIMFKDTNGIIVNSNNLDVKVWSVWGNSGAYAEQYGFHQLYKGTGDGNNNSLHLYAHNGSSTHVEVYEMKQDGTTTWKKAINFTGGISEGGTALSTKYQAKDDDLTAIAGLTATKGFLKKTAANTWALEELSIPAAQIQSDWNQTDTSKLDYIKNKPTILNPVDYYWANIKVAASSSNATTPVVKSLGISDGSSATAAAKATWQYNDTTKCVVLTW